MSLINDALHKLGELFIIGFEGTELSDDTAAFLSQSRIGGVILFSKNYKNPEQVSRLIQQIQECRTELPLWISVDQEGGRVQRFKEHFTILPKAADIGKTGSPKLAFDVAEVIAKELKAVGINLNFCPDTDIHTNPNNPVIGDRSYGSTEEIVSKMVTAMARGHLINGVQPCVKHFPGHGDTSVDSHFELPKVETDLKELREREFKPFVKAFKSRCSFVMTAHILNPGIDPEMPATLSSKTLREILRKELRYSKIILSDDLEMEAITKHFGAKEAPVLALKAGCDMLIYRTENAARHAFEAVTQSIEEGELTPESILESATRSQDLKKEFLMPYAPPSASEIKKIVGCTEHKEIVARIPTSS